MGMSAVFPGFRIGVGRAIEEGEESKEGSGVDVGRAKEGVDGLR